MIERGPLADVLAEVRAAGVWTEGLKLQFAKIVGRDLAAACFQSLTFEVPRPRKRGAPCRPRGAHGETPYNRALAHARNVARALEREHGLIRADAEAAVASHFQTLPGTTLAAVFAGDHKAVAIAARMWTDPAEREAVRRTARAIRK